MKEIRDSLENSSKTEEERGYFKTRLIHYWIRTKRLREYTEEENDLKDIDALHTSIRSVYNAYFPYFSPAKSQEYINQINQSIAKLMTEQSNGNSISPENVQSDENAAGQSSAMASQSMKRNLVSVQKLEEIPNAMNTFPKLFANAMQMWVSQYMPPQFSQEHLAQIVPPSSDVSNPPKITITRKVKTPPRKKEVDYKSDQEQTESSSTDSDGAIARYRRHSRKSKHYHRSSKARPVSEWKLRYDGTDNGLTLMKFLKEVEFYADSENMSRRELFRSAIHLFSGPAKTWFMTGFENEDFNSWSELKEELKREFLSPDHNHMSEIRAISRRQAPRESFQDYFLDLQRIFNSFTKPMSERRKFEIVFRNMRSDYKGHAVASEIDNLADLKKFGRRLDATFWYKYQPTADEPSRNKTRLINEVQTGAKPKARTRNEIEQHKTRSFYPSKPRYPNPEEGSERTRRTEKPHTREIGQLKGIDAILENYQPPKDGYCYNCRLKGHQDRDCNKPKHQYCLRCGFHNVHTMQCPYCSKNFRKTVFEGKTGEHQ